jgi:hypothetical protein
MTRDTNSSRELGADRILVETALKLFDRDEDGFGKANKEELLGIANELRTSSVDDLALKTQLLPNYILKNKEVLLPLFRKNTQQALDFLAEVCNHYENVKKRRDLTEEEKALGKAMSELLELINKNLDEL